MSVEIGQNVSNPFARPLAFFELKVARADIVCAHVPGDDIESVCDGNGTSTPADHDRQLGLGVDVPDAGGEDDRLVGVDERVRELPEQQWLGRELEAQLGRVVDVVQADADDLLRKRAIETPLPGLLDSLTLHAVHARQATARP